MYRTQNGVRSVLLDDDTCDCFSTLSMGHGMCASSFRSEFGPANRFGVDVLHENGCTTPNPVNSLTLYFKGINVQLVLALVHSTLFIINFHGFRSCRQLRAEVHSWVLTFCTVWHRNRNMNLFI